VTGVHVKFVDDPDRMVVNEHLAGLLQRGGDPELWSIFRRFWGAKATPNQLRRRPALRGFTIVLDLAPASASR
jgi:hypothetical protein